MLVPSQRSYPRDALTHAMLIAALKGYSVTYKEFDGGPMTTYGGADR
jgi:hypothetical protein